jgi:hypothetical protein
LEFSLHMSQACLGKSSTFNIKSGEGKKGSFSYLPISSPLTPGRWSKQLQSGVARQWAAQSETLDQ